MQLLGILHQIYCLSARQKNLILLYSTTDATNSLKTSVSNGKSAVASAITDKGVSTSATASFNTMASNIRSISQAHDYKNGNIRPFFNMRGEATIIYFCTTPRYIRIKMADYGYVSSAGMYQISYADLTVEVGKSYAASSYTFYRYQIVYYSDGKTPAIYEWNPFTLSDAFKVTNNSYSNFSIIELTCISSTANFIFGRKTNLLAATPSGSVEFIY